MNKKTAFCLATLLLASVSAWAEAVDPPMVEIPCSLTPIDRSKFHRPGADATTQISSTNWSGFVAANNFTTPSNDTVTYAAGSWIVPTLLPTPDDSYCAIWVGIDGFLNGTVEQIGTGHDWFNGAQQNYAWFEMYPMGSFGINNFPVNNGDLIAVRVGYKGSGIFKLVILNYTQGVSTVIPSSYTTSASALRSSAEWVVEAPFGTAILPLSDFQKITFNSCSATISGVTGSISNGAWMNDEITMEKTIGVEAQPTALLKSGTCFQVAWEKE